MCTNISFKWLQINKFKLINPFEILETFFKEII